MCVAIPGEVTWMGHPAPGLIPGEVSTDDRVVDVNLVMVPDVEVGQHVITHSGFAIRIVDEHEVARIRELLG